MGIRVRIIPGRQLHYLSYTPDVAGILTLILAPVFLVIGLCIFVASPGPVLYRQVRLSHNGRQFNVLKFRTMIPDADRLLDELPQLINVLKGDMSLVGPRPPLPGEVDEYEIWQRRRLSMKPGLTCYWQIAPRRNDLTFDEWMKLDLSYIDNWSLQTDFMLLFKTAGTVLTGAGR